MQMRALFISPTTISDDNITEMLQQLRKNALIDSSHFAVAAIVEIRLKNGSYAYVSGVNAENEEHNKLGLHGEQNAIAAAQTFFGGKVKFSEAWVMGAPDTIHKGSDHFLANNAVKPCGHCRQILLSMSTDKADVYSVSVNGKVFAPDTLAELLPKAFSERDLGTQAETETEEQASKSNPSMLYSSNLQYFPTELLLQTTHLNDKVIQSYLRSIKPHIINEQHKTSPIDTCILKIKSGNSIHYVPGALIQDAAFQTTDTIFTAMGMAVTQFGKNFELEEVYLHSKSLSPTQLSSAETEYLVRFTNKDIPIKAFKINGNGENASFTLDDVITAKSSRLHQKIRPEPGIENTGTLKTFGMTND